MPRMHGISTATAGGVVGAWMDSLPEHQLQQHLKATKPHNQGPGHPGDVAYLCGLQPCGSLAIVGLLLRRVLLKLQVALVWRNKASVQEP